MDEVFPGVYLVEEGEIGGGWRELTWFVDTTEGGLLIDPQTFGPATAQAVDRLGGTKAVFVTHALAAGDACKFKERYRAKLFAHRQVAPAIRACAPDALVEGDSPVTLGVRAIFSGVHSAGSTMLYVMRDRGFLFPGDFMTISGGKGAATLQVRDGGDPEAKRRALLHLKALRFGAVLPFLTRHDTANHIVGPSESVVDALIRTGAYTLR